MEKLRAIFQGVDDPRKSNAKKHDLIEMLVIALLATLSGKSSCSSFARYAKVNCEFLRGFLELKGGPPSHDSFSDLFNALDPEQMAGALTELAKMLLAALPGDPADQVAIDGKVLKGAILDASSKSALHLVQAFEPGAGLVLGQVKVDGKSNEITALPALLEILDLNGRTAAADAMHTQREASALIVEKGGNYVLPVKRNQKSLHEDVRDWFDDPEAQKEMLSCQHVDGGTGASRRASRRSRTMSAGCRICTAGPASRPSAGSRRSASGRANRSGPSDTTS